MHAFTTLVTYMENANINSIKKFLFSFRKKEENLLNLKIDYELPFQKSFLNNFKLLNKIASKLIENEAPKFNLFDILHINRLEAKVHTPFLAELLNPQGTHRQYRLFFDAFMKHLFKESFESEKISSISTRKELSDYANGRMDIVISYKDDSFIKAIVIENKIYHDDEEEQLTKYHRYLTKTLNLASGQYHLVYLTPYKTKPGSYSISPELYDELRNSSSLTELGYHNDIIPILYSTITEVKAPVVRETLHQYIEALKKL